MLTAQGFEAAAASTVWKELSLNKAVEGGAESAETPGGRGIEAVAEDEESPLGALLLTEGAAAAETLRDEDEALAVKLLLELATDIDVESTLEVVLEVAATSESARFSIFMRRARDVPEFAFVRLVAV